MTKNNLYGNYVVQTMDGEKLFIGSKKRVFWYLKKGLAEKIDEKTVRLNFEPKHRSAKGDMYYLTTKDNKCVVCGEENIEILSKHHIVPYEYRKFLPKNIKSRSSHDIVPITIEHHAIYELEANKLKADLLIAYGIDTDSKTAYRIDRAISLGKVLVDRRKKIPSKRLRQIEADFILYSGIEVYDKKIIEEYINKHKANKKTTGEQVVQKVIEAGEIQEFVELWRNHFINTMKPKHMPKYWDIKRKI